MILKVKAVMKLNNGEEAVTIKQSYYNLNSKFDKIIICEWNIQLEIHGIIIKVA